MILHTLLPMTSQANKLPLETEPVACDNNTIFMLKHGDQTFVVPYSTDNRSNVHAAHGRCVRYFPESPICSMFAQNRDLKGPKSCLAM